ncbi:MAG: IclR family transcriptional regulator [Chloroflexota bacterium]|nr:IclR family transcriptional regulator [Chloroflexota bacterium]
MSARFFIDAVPAPRRADDGTTSLEKGLGLLEALSATRGGAGVTELARRLGQPKSSVARLLLVLSRRGYVWREPDRPVYRIGPRALELTANALDELLVVAQARPHLYDLAGRLRHIAGLGVLWGGTAVVVDLVEPSGATPAPLSHEQLVIGRGAPAYCSSVGKAILAHRPAADVTRYLDTTPLARRTARTIIDRTALLRQLETIRDLGWAVNDGESRPGGTSVAAPIFNDVGEALAAVTVTNTHQPGEAPTAGIVAAVMEAARRVSFHLGRHPRAVL